MRISCQASGYQDGSQLTWTSDASWAHGGGKQWEFTVHDDLLAPTAEVFLEECQGATCQTVVATVDTSSIVPATTTAPVTTAAPAVIQGSSVAGKGVAELLDVRDGVAAWLSMGVVIKAISLVDPSAPVVVGEISTAGTATGIFTNDEYFFTSGSKGVQVIGRDDPLGQPLGTFDFKHGPTSVEEDGVLFVAAGDEVIALDVQDPSAPRQLSRSSLSGRAPSNMRKAGDFLFVPATVGGGLNIFDVSDPNSLQQVSVVPFESFSVGLAVDDGYAYLARSESYSMSEVATGFSSISALDVIDISSPSNPYVVGSVVLQTDARDLFRVDDLIYVVGAFENELLIVDVSSPTSPVVHDVPDTAVKGSNFRHAYREGNYAYLIDSGNGVRVLDLTDRLNPTVVARLDLPMIFNCVHGYGAMLYLCAREQYFNLADVSDPDNPVHLHSGTAVAGSFRYTSVVLLENKLVFNTRGLQVYDISDPSDPRYVPVNIAADSVAIRDNYLFTTIGEIGLIAYDITDLDSAQTLSRSPFPIGMPMNASLDGNWLVGMSALPYSISLFDVTDPWSPRATDWVELDTAPTSVTVKDGYVYVSLGSGTRGVDVFKIGTEGQLLLEANISGTDEWAYSDEVAVVSDRAYVLAGNSVVKVFDISDPGTPIQIGAIPISGMPTQLEVVDDHIFLADGESGLTVISLDLTAYP